MNDERGQGLLELVIALGVLVTGLTVALTLAIANTVYNREAGDRVIAANLAREGLEVVEHIRFSNFDLGRNWDMNLEQGSYAAIFDPSATPPWRLDSLTDANSECAFQDNGSSPLFGMRLQGATGGVPTGFRRTITIRDICKPTIADCSGLSNVNKIGLRVSALVEWGKGTRRTVSTEATYYHWQ